MKRITPAQLRRANSTYSVPAPYVHPVDAPADAAAEAPEQTVQKAGLTPAAVELFHMMMDKSKQLPQQKPTASDE